jgi:hypothetical protein
MATNFITSNNLSDADIQQLLTDVAADPQPVPGEDDLAFYRTDAMSWASVGPAPAAGALLKELQFLESLGVALRPDRPEDPWHVDRLTVGELYRPVGGATTGILWLSAPENAKAFLRFLQRTTLPAYVRQGQAIAKLPPTLQAGIAARQQTIEAEGALRRIGFL